jgi:ABC-type phosphate transport system substrate-binding protein
MRAIHKIAVLGAAVVAFGSIGVGTALADPYPPLSGPPALTTLEGVGSDTITPLFSGNETYNSSCQASGGQTSGDIAQDYDATKPANLLYSWDAVNPCTGAVGDTIVTKASSSSDATCSMARPDGSSAGITALENTKTDDGSPCIDYARSSRPPETTDPNTIAFDQLFGDGITYASPSGGDAVSGLTWEDLAAIYTCQDTNWSDFGGTNATIDPVLPQTGSGTRATFLLDLGGGVTPITPGSCVTDNGTDSAGTIEENTGVTAPNEQAFSNPAALFPYAISAYIAQGTATNGVGGHSTSIWAHGNLVLNSMTDDNNDLQAPITTNSSDQPIINPDWVSELQRTIYVVVDNGGTATAPAWPTNSPEASALQTVFGPSGWLCTNSTAQADVLSYGFTSYGAACGSLTTEELTYG